MGLDMYLSAKRYLSKYSEGADAQKIEQINDVFGLVGDEEGDYGTKEVSFRVGYWRKANAIHAWFVKNCQEDVDDCREAWVSREQLTELSDICSQIILKPKLANELLPPQSGFFFGSTEVDEWYIQDLKYTVERIQKILGDEALERCDFYYQSSW